MSRGTGTLPASSPPLLSALPSLGATDLLHCINLQVEGKTRQMKKTARQYLLLTYVCDLAKSMPGRDARDAIRPLFRKMATSDESREAFNDHLAKYIAHVKTRAEAPSKHARVALLRRSPHNPPRPNHHHARAPLFSSQVGLPGQVQAQPPELPRQ